MVAIFQWIERTTKIHVVVQTGAGKFFCTGMELVDDDATAPMSFALGSDFHTLNKLLIGSNKMLIAAVNGPAAGYGVTSLALYDLVYAVPEAYFFTPFTRLGMAAEGASSLSFPRLMGHQRAATLLLAGDRISAQDAERFGLISKILPAADFVKHVVEIAERLARSPQGALRATKGLMRQGVRQELLDANDRECALIQGERHGSKENRDAVARFRQERRGKRAAKSQL
ncbi:dodecenoyl-CoA delta-isomerase [Lophiostoma macrostomum CBS 122681]|uniref:Dodecenoyl-CoA delta-isomerase n=1 Tax=Lophiostoma macrostomum CBS 122681 TaxID=1314788 RepID=A0A6A6SKN8_9PLEO|nr:dodecenoyl-CoA delta-isomerase [Lophiostoma macrostomum CBS 122681]